MKKGNKTLAFLAFWAFVIAVGAVLMILTACETDDPIRDNAVTVLKTAKATWEGLQDQAAEMRFAGRLTDAQWADWKDIDMKYRATHNAAVEALKTYELTKGKPAEEALFAALGNLTEIIKRAGDLISAWKGGE